MKPGLTGIETVMGNLNKEVVKIQGKTMQGLLVAAAHVRRDMEPLIPVDLGNLRASFFVTSTFEGGGTKPVVTLGFSANYAWFVHENVDATFKRPGAESKFLEKSMKRSTGEIIKILKQNY